MAKYEFRIKTDYDELLDVIENEILNRSTSATLEEKSDFFDGDAKCSVRHFERFSVVGSNRLGLNITLFQVGDGDIHVSATSTGGSQAILFKINTLGEEAFIKQFREIINERYGEMEEYDG